MGSTKWTPWAIGQKERTRKGEGDMLWGEVGGVREEVEVPGGVEGKLVKMQFFTCMKSSENK